MKQVETDCPVTWKWKKSFSLYM